MIVDDQYENRFGIRQVLELHQFLVVEAENGYSALKILEEQNVDLILSDVAMPNMNGYQLFERVRMNPDWLFIPFIFLTARSLNSDIQFGKSLGVDDYLLKPIDFDDLISVVQGKLKRMQQLHDMQTAVSEPSPFPPEIAPEISKITSESGTLTLGRLSLNRAQHRVWLNKQEISFSTKEFALLDVLTQKSPDVCATLDIIKATHDFETDYTEASNLLRPLIRSLRRKLTSDTTQANCIETVRGIGYRLRPLPFSL